MLSENGVNLIRVRVWNDPFDSQGRGYGGGNCDIDAAVEIGKRAAAAGLPLLVDFHYSDFWADPGKQMAPKAWKGMDIDEEKVPAVAEYTRDCLQKLKDAGVSVAMVQLGNETNGMLCGEKIWMNIYKIMNAGSKAVREIYPDALIAVHFANPENGDAYRSWASKLAYYHLDYDVFGTSYYPYWHGTLDNLKTVLSEIADTYGKKVMVMETSYAWTAADGDFSGNSIGEGGVYDKPYPFSVQGQVNEFTDVAQAMADIGGIGVCYWEGAWVRWARLPGRKTPPSGSNTAPAGPPATPGNTTPTTRASITRQRLRQSDPVRFFRQSPAVPGHVQSSENRSGRAPAGGSAGRSDPVL
jgi:arabinogalactan endo-1,4-beta-galactosidase